MGFLTVWKQAEAAFEAATGRKRPAAGFWGWFRGAGGVDRAVQKLDEATKTGGESSLRKAEQAFRRAMLAYGVRLDHAVQAETSAEGKQALETLRAALRGIETDFGAQLAQVRTKQAAVRRTKAEALRNTVDDAMKKVRSWQGEWETLAAAAEAAQAEAARWAGEDRSAEAQAAARRAETAAAAMAAVVDKAQGLRKAVREMVLRETRSQREAEGTPGEGETEGFLDQAKRTFEAMEGLIRTFEESAKRGGRSAAKGGN